jgi:hypothetical protein
MSEPKPADFAALYARFQAPIAALDCGSKCAPYNERGVPFCCDVRHALPTAYQEEWDYLQPSTELWHAWEAGPTRAEQDLAKSVPGNQVAIICQGHTRCQRDFRAITCRSFPFFPYLTLTGEFLGLSYYWEYEDRCWVISNLQVVTAEYLEQFVSAYEMIFTWYPEERETFRQHSIHMRRVFGQRRRAIPLLHRNGGVYRITPGNGRLRRADAGKLPSFGPYRIAARLPFKVEEI